MIPAALWRPAAEILAALCAGMLIVLVIATKRAAALAARLEEQQFQNRSLSTTYGRITEQWFPLMATYPYDPQYFRFLGSPIDGVQFEQDRIVFVEFKTNRSRLSAEQRRLRKLVEDGQVFWEEYRFEAEEP